MNSTLTDIFEVSQVSVSVVYIRAVVDVS